MNSTLREELLKLTGEIFDIGYKSANNRGDDYVRLLEIDNEILALLEKYNEVWVPTSGFEGYYEVSNLGRLRSVKTRKVIGNYVSDTIPYLNVGLSIDGVMKTIGLHQLVARSFVSNPKNKPQVNHLDGNKRNNRADNLEWCTPSENLLHAFRILKRVTRKTLKDADILEIRKRLKSNEKQNSIAKDYNVSESLISLIKKGNHPTRPIAQLTKALKEDK